MDTVDKKIIIKSKFRGFDKKGVIEYIRNLSEKYDEAMAAKQTEADNYKSAMEEEKSKNSALETRVAELSETERKLCEVRRKLEDAEAENSELKEKLKALSEIVETNYIPDKTRLEGEVEKLKDELNATRRETEINKAEVADVLIKADKLAKKLQEDAIMSANAEKAEIEKQIISKKSELLGINGEIERMKNVFQELYTKYVDK